MSDLKISELIAMQNALQNRMKDKWLPIIPENGHFSLLWMFEEMGEIVAIVKKRGDSAIMKDETVRAAFVEELSDALMYFIDLMSCYNISADELSVSFIKKHEKNMHRDFVTEHKNYLERLAKPEEKPDIGNGDEDVKAVGKRCVVGAN